MLLSKLRWSIAWFLLVIIGGTAGYRYIEGWNWLDSFWMVVITLTTIGYGETHPLTWAGRLYTIALIILGVSLGTYTAGQLTRYVVEGSLLEQVQNRRRRRTMGKLSNHYIVVGYGRLGREVAAELSYRQNEVVVVDSSIETAVHDPKGRLITILGDGTDDDILKETAIDKARALAATTGNDVTNIFITLSARQLNPNLHIITRVDDEASIPKALRAGADEVINPYGISGARMAQGLTHPHAAQLMDRAVGRDHAEFEIEDIRIGENPSYHGKLSEIDIPDRHNVLILALRTKKDGLLRTDLGRDTVLSEGDIAVVVGRPDDLRNFSTEAGSSDS